MCWSGELKNYGSRLRSKWYTFFYNYSLLIINMTLTFTNEPLKHKAIHHSLTIKHILLITNILSSEGWNSIPHKSITFGGIPH